MKSSNSVELNQDKTTMEGRTTDRIYTLGIDNLLCWHSRDRDLIIGESLIKKGYSQIQLPE